eukprot:TRINITY_DN71904_c0_g1_i1.p1 TRINITY_DN71904_c0_g1~~TRINITY_DN71904_c0_g1_i1.p1  ORF type:complete len:662 (+),score=125.72 TRINITY_DN71904_c0_g1_i1:86-1987(+)
MASAMYPRKREWGEAADDGYYGSVKLRRTEPAQDAGEKYKTQMCKFFLQGNCQKGSACTYSHAESERRQADPPAPEKYKTEMCKFFPLGQCRKGDACTYSHGKADEFNGARSRQSGGGSAAYGSSMPSGGGYAGYSSGSRAGASAAAGEPRRGPIYGGGRSSESSSHAEASSSATPRGPIYGGGGFRSGGASGEASASAAYGGKAAGREPAPSSRVGRLSLANGGGGDDRGSYSGKGGAAPSSSYGGGSSKGSGGGYGGYGGSHASEAEAKNYKTVMCKFFAVGQCTKGDQCTYAHYAEEQGRGGDDRYTARAPSYSDYDSPRQGAPRYGGGGNASGGPAGTYGTTLPSSRDPSTPAVWTSSILRPARGSGKDAGKSVGKGSGKDGKSFGKGNAAGAMAALPAQAWSSKGAPPTNSRYKTEACKFFAIGACTKGNACTFRHEEPVPVVKLAHQRQVASGGRTKEAITAHNYKTELCKYFESKKGCDKGEACPYAHGESELRKPGGPSPAEGDPRPSGKQPEQAAAREFGMDMDHLSEADKVLLASIEAEAAGEGDTELQEELPAGDAEEDVMASEGAAEANDEPYHEEEQQEQEQEQEPEHEEEQDYEQESYPDQELQLARALQELERATGDR